MPSKFDYPDPSRDADYCAGLEFDEDVSALPEYTCAWCGAEMLPDNHDYTYCSPLCAVHAETDESER